VHNVSQWPNLRHLGEPLRGAEGLLEAEWVLRRRRRVWVEVEDGQCVIPSLFHSRLKPFLFHKSFSPQISPSFRTDLTKTIFTVRRRLHGLSYRNSVRPSVRTSVCPSVTLVHCVHMVRPANTISSPHRSPIILVSGDIKFIPKFEGDHTERGRWMRVGWILIGDFRPISQRISETVRDTTKVTINH